MNDNSQINSSKTALIIQQACNELGLRSKFIDDAKFVLMVDLAGKSHIFVANNTGLNDEVVRKICNDKFYTYLLLKDEVSFPKTLSFVDPNADDIYQDHGVLSSNQKVVEEILKNHQFPILVKANSLSRGLNVFKCESNEKVGQAVRKIFKKKSKNYDHVLISQDYIELAEEYRVVVYNQKIMLAYKKDRGSAKFAGNLSPLHWENSKSMLVEDREVLDELRGFIKPIYSKLKLRYGGLDIARDKKGALKLIEINTQPGFSYFTRDNSDDRVFEMFKKILKDLEQNKGSNGK